MENNDTHMQHVSTPRTESGSPSATDLAVIFNEVTTARLALRRLRSTDGSAMFSVHGDPATYRYTPVAPHPDLATLARTYLSAWPVVARTRAKNIPSIRTAERAGLVRRPDLDTEHIVFALGWAPTGAL